MSSKGKKFLTRAKLTETGYERLRQNLQTMLWKAFIKYSYGLRNKSIALPRVGVSIQGKQPRCVLSRVISLDNFCRDFFSVLFETPKPFWFPWATFSFVVNTPRVWLDKTVELRWYDGGISTQSIHHRKKKKKNLFWMTDKISLLSGESPVQARLDNLIEVYSLSLDTTEAIFAVFHWLCLAFITWSEVINGRGRGCDQRTDRMEHSCYSSA